VGESGATLAAAMAEILRIVEDCNWRRRKSNKLKKIHKRKREIYTLKIHANSADYAGFGVVLQLFYRSRIANCYIEF